MTPTPSATEAVAWRHVLHMELGQTAVRLARAEVDRPFGKPGIDYSAEYTVTITPLCDAKAASDEIERLRAALQVAKDEWRDVAAENAALKAKLATAVEALGPFATEMVENDGSERIDFASFEDTEFLTPILELTMGDFRRAREAHATCAPETNTGGQNG